MPYTGRFAPSPTGPLHLGSLVAALASWLDARAAGGRWLVRIEDVDRPREVRGAADEILRQLSALGLDWDGEVTKQVQRAAAYERELGRLGDATYWCACTRKEVGDSALAADGARIYPGTCRNGIADGKTPRAMRVRTDSTPISFTDRVQGECSQSVEREVGDFVLLRADGLHAYQLAVVVDDAEQGVTDVVRGADLLDSTARQIHLQRLLGYAQPRYLHVPVAVTADGEKLSKKTGARAAGVEDVPCALALLGHPPPPGLAVREMLEWAKMNWNPARIPRTRTLQVP